MNDLLTIVMDFALLILSFGAMHFVSEKYFIGSLDHISKKLRLSSDMAGSTLMAAGSSAPELAVALFSILMAGNHEAIGVGTIVGSALFNILVITGVVMYIRGTVKMIWQPLFRDIVFYILSIILLAYIFSDQQLSLSGSLIMVGIYVVYVAVVYFWKRIRSYEDIEPEPEKTGAHPKWSSWVPGIFVTIDGFFTKFHFVVFFVSVAMISLLSWVLVKSAVSLSQTLGIPELIIGITIVAVGTSVPDLISSVIVARQGRPGMAINNAIGSNIFDILIGLGLPFLLFMIFNPEGLMLASENLALSVGILLASACVLLVFFLFAGWRSSRAFGIILIVLYFLYLGHVIFSAI
ncbi:MAG TPA: calcium/sodium antiporter [Bacteroidales bacterium]|nr:calcium/sodium antiporter [Bacteroidales bacterium]